MAVLSVMLSCVECHAVVMVMPVGYCVDQPCSQQIISTVTIGKLDKDMTVKNVRRIAPKCLRAFCRMGHTDLPVT